LLFRLAALNGESAINPGMIWFQFYSQSLSDLNLQAIKLPSQLRFGLFKGDPAVTLHTQTYRHGPELASHTSITQMQI
jgi:hypothetical protein